MTVMPPPPTRHALLASASDLIRTVDEHARVMNIKWGTNRLPHLVPLEWLDRFRAQKRKWELACFECTGSPKPEDEATIRKHAEAMLRAYDKLDQIATEEGHTLRPAGQWEFELADGTPIILVQTRAEMAQVTQSSGRNAAVWALEEIAAIIERFPAVCLVKDAFPAAEVIQLRTSKIVVDGLNDSIADLVPF
jgi:hypothetical protein